MSVTDLSDEQLLLHLKKGDKQAFTEIYNRYAESLAGFAASKLYNLDDARDILHDLFVKLWEERQTLAINDNLKSYLFAALRYRIIDKIRRNVTRQEYARMLKSMANSYPYGIEKNLEAKELQQLLEKSLEELPTRTRQIYRLSRQEHQSITEIAQKLNLSEQTIKNQLTMALKHLRQKITAINIGALFTYWWLH